MKIAVYGSAVETITREIREKAREIGREIAKKNHILVTGACPGLPYEAVLGAYELNGECIGFSPAYDLETHIKREKFPTEGFSKLIYVSKDYEYVNESLICRKHRNVLSGAYVDVGIIIGGRIGTMHEFTTLYDLGKNIGILKKTGGITKRAIRVLIEDANKDRGSILVEDTDPITLVNTLIEISQ